MNKAEQGVLRYIRQNHLIACLVLLIFCITSPALSADKKSEVKYNVYIMQASGSSLHSSISQQLAVFLNDKPNFNVIQITPDETQAKINNKTDIIVSIGTEANNSADKHYPSTKKLHITSYLDSSRIEKITHQAGAILYMTQPYCRQLKLIKLIEESWQTVGLLHTENKSSVVKTIRDCANKYNLNIYSVKKDADENISYELRDVLIHSDVLLALPESEIYNGNTVKNILLTSYRFRKPVIAFSENFVTAGALASVHSNTEQIAESASDIIDHYFRQNRRFERIEYYPQSFDIDINKHVIKALGLTHPNIYSLEALLADTEPSDTGKRK